MANNTKTIVNHYKRRHAGSRHCEIIEERVEPNSDTAKFLEQLESKKLERECLISVDMRGKAPGNISTITHNGLIHHFDDISFSIFNKSINENRGKFTYSAYESIINGPHTYKANQTRQQHGKSTVPDPATGTLHTPKQQKTRPKCLDKYNAPELDAPELLRTGYYKRRNEDRLVYSTEVIADYKGITFKGITRDLSSLGMRIRLETFQEFTVGSAIKITLPNLRARVQLKSMSYTIVSSEKQEHRIDICLRRSKEEENHPTVQCVEEYIEKHKAKYKIDTNEESYLAECVLNEKLYATNIPSIPLYLEDTADGPSLKWIGRTRSNEPIIRIFEMPDGGLDFSPFLLKQRLSAALSNQSRGQQRSEGSMLLAVFRLHQSGTLYSISDLEMRSTSSFYKTLINVQNTAWAYHVLLIEYASIDAWDDGKLRDLLAKVTIDDPEYANALKQEAQKITAYALVTDITQQAKSCATMKTALPIRPDRSERSMSSDDELEVHAWATSSLVDVSTGSIVDTGEIQEAAPELIDLGYQARRRESRYKHQTSAEFTLDSKIYQSTTQDISVNGLSLTVKNHLKIQRGTIIYVSLTKLAKMLRNSKDIADIPYKVVRTRNRGGETTLMLERIFEDKRHWLRDFFLDLIKKNKDKLTECGEEKRYLARSRVCQAIAAQNIPGIVSFVTKDSDRACAISRALLPSYPTHFMERLKTEGSNGEFDLSLISNRRSALQALSKIRRSPDNVQIEMYAFYDPQDGAFVMMEGGDFENASTREQFIEFAASYPSHFFGTITIGPINKIEEAEIDTALSAIALQARHRSSQIHKSISETIMVMQFTDLTCKLDSMRSEYPEQTTSEHVK